jgi:hypothetical protein
MAERLFMKSDIGQLNISNFGKTKTAITDTIHETYVHSARRSDWIGDPALGLPSQTDAHADFYESTIDGNHPVI